MPLYNSIKVNSQTIVKIWHITEPIEVLLDAAELSNVSIQKLESLKTDRHKRGFLSVRLLLQEFGYNDESVFYNSKGKPFLKDGKHISITHSYEYSALAIGSQKVGIDVERVRDKITSIACKFTGFETCFLNTKEGGYKTDLTRVWCIKEALYKLYSKPGLSFKNQILVIPFGKEHLKTIVWILEDQNRLRYDAHLYEFNGYCCAITTPLL